MKEGNAMAEKPGADERVVYRIDVQGELGGDWSNWFSGLTVVSERTNAGFPVTTLIGPVADQAALRGMLCKLWDLNLILISVHRVEADDGKKKEG
jgi:hypothetical protein